MRRTLMPYCLLLMAGAHSVADIPEPLASIPGVQNVFRIHSTLLSGSQPEAASGFDTLRKLGVRTILSVDGAIPDVEAARARDLRYIHLPIGYDGIPTERFLQLAQVALTAEGPVYVHCHQGQHRGPVAVAILGLLGGDLTRPEAVAWLHQAGTSTNYAGLYRGIREYQPPTPIQLAALTHALPEISNPSDLVQTMVSLDEHHEHLQAAQRAEWTHPPDHPDVNPAHEALMLWETLKELQRTPQMTASSPEFHERLNDTTDAAARLHLSLQAKDVSPSAADLDPLLSDLSTSCIRCHETHRN
jgi:protein tyrosine phosphatase (PTP) superfamily phosphohydrolase (DUF442 family)